MITTLLIGAALGYLGPKLLRRKLAPAPVVDARRQLGDACIALRQAGHRVQERTVGTRTFVVVDKKVKG